MLKYAIVCSALVLSTSAWCHGQDAAPAEEAKPVVSEELLSLFKLIDELGRDKIAKAKFVEVKFVGTEDSGKPWSEKCWLIEQDAKTISVLDDDLIILIYRKDAAALSPSSWSPVPKKVQSVKDIDFEQFCKELVAPKPKDSDRFAFTLRGIGPSHCLLVAHAAWKHGLEGYCNRLIPADLARSEGGFAAYRQAVLDDLAWLHFLRGVNLLKFADRSEVLPHLRLVGKLSPESEYAATSKDLAERLEKLVAEEAKKPAADVDESKLSDEKKVAYYIAQLKDLHAVQISQPGNISPYFGKLVAKHKADAAAGGAKEEEPLPTEKLKGLGMKAVPALIEALSDDS